MTRRRVCDLHGPGCRGPWSNLSSSERARITALVLEVKGRDCWVKGCTTVASTPDHIVPDSVSHDHRLANLRPSCLAHNQSRGAGPSGDGAYGVRLTIVTDLDAPLTGIDLAHAIVLDALALGRALDLPTHHPIVRSAMTAATRAAARLTTPTHVVVIDPALPPADLTTYLDRGATLVGPTPSHTPTPSRAW